MVHLMSAGVKYTPEETYDFWYNRIHPDYVEQVQDYLKNMMRGDKAVQKEFVWNHPQYGNIVLRFGGKCVKKFNGLLVFTVVISSIVVNMTHMIMQKDADRLLNNVCKKEAAYINDILGDVEKSAKVMEYYATTGISELEDLRDKEHRTAYIESAKKC